MGCGYLPTGYLPTGYLPIGAATTGGGSLRGKSAAAATLSMATSPAVTIMTIFMMLIPLCCSPGRADRVTPLFRFICARRPLLPSHVPAQSPGGLAPDYLSLWAMDWSKLYFLPEQLMAEVAKDLEKGRVRFVEAQVAIAIDLQLALSLRPQNLSS